MQWYIDKVVEKFSYYGSTDVGLLRSACGMMKCFIDGIMVWWNYGLCNDRMMKYWNDDIRELWHFGMIEWGPSEKYFKPMLRNPADSGEPFYISIKLPPQQCMDGAVLTHVSSIAAVLSASKVKAGRQIRYKKYTKYILYIRYLK